MELYQLIVVLCAFVIQNIDNELIKKDFPDTFRSQGAVNLPYGDIEQHFDLWYDYSYTRLRLDIDNGLNRVIIKNDKIHQIFYYAEDDMNPKLKCVSESIKGVEILNEYFPDITKFRYDGIDTFSGLNKWLLNKTVLNTTNFYTLLMDKNNNPVSFTSMGVDYFSHSHPDEYVTTYKNFTRLKSIDESIFEISSYKCDHMSSKNQKSFNLSPFLGIHGLKIKEDMLGHMINRLNHLGYRSSANFKKNGTLWFEMKAEMVNSIDQDYDWRLYGVGAHVKDQGSCGSCWTFSVVGAIEGAQQVALLRKTKLPSFDLLSEQYLVDCSWKLNNGCDGGNPGDTLDWVVKNEIPFSTSYGRYHALNGKCHKTGNLFSIKKVYQIGKSITKAGKIKEIKQALKQFGPLSVAVSVTEPFVYYKGGIYGSSDCDGPLNHAVVLVGYAMDPISNLPYWIVRNSWSTKFGVNGFIHISMEHDCGLTDEVYGVEV